MWTRKMYKDEIARLNFRIEELEERLCPCESHEWKLVDSVCEPSDGSGVSETIFKHKCKRCGKVVYKCGQAGVAVTAKQICVEHGILWNEGAREATLNGKPVTSEDVADAFKVQFDKE